MPSPFPDSAVAVIGMACNFPGGSSPEQLWETLETGASTCRDLPETRIPAFRFDQRSYSRKFRAHLIDDVDAFDHAFFNIASREAKFMDPQQRLALQVTYQALESSGYFAGDEKGTERDIGSYWATTLVDYADQVASHPPSAFSLTGTVRAFIAGKVSHFFGFTGPALVFDAACAASGTAIHHACRAVAAGDCQGAVVGATTIFASPHAFQDLASGQFTSPSGESRSFDAAADGYGRGEGVAVVVLKKLSAALADGDSVMGVIASSAVNQCMNESSIVVPHGPSQATLYTKALRLAGLVPEDVSYVEAHGTGTPLGDPIETTSIRDVFGDASGKRRSITQLGSVKSSIGHTESASGMASLVKVLLMLQKGIIPPQALLRNVNPAIPPLEPVGIQIPRAKTPWTADFKIACVNNYGASGTNVVMVVTEPPPPRTDASPTVGRSLASSAPVDTYPISITAFSPSSLKAYCSSLLDFVDRSKEPSEQLCRDIAYHLSRRRNSSLPFSVCSVISSLQDLRNALRSAISNTPSKQQDKQLPVVLFFGGQTGQATPISPSLYDSAAIFRKHLLDCDTTLQTLGARSIFPAVFESKPQNDAVLDQAILFSAQYASAMAWLDCGLQPARLIGHSFGQLTALCVSGVLSLHDGLRLIIERATLIERNWGSDAGAMIAVEAELDHVNDLLNQHADLRLEIACYNGPRSFVLAGATKSVDAMEEVLQSSLMSMRWKRLRVPNAFHTGLTEPLLQLLREVACELTYNDPNIPVETCSKDASWSSTTPALVASHIKEPVYFHEAVERLSGQLGPCTWLEVGLGTGTGAGMIKRALGTQASSHHVRSLSLQSTSSMASLAEMTEDLWRSGLKVQFWPFHRSQQHMFGRLNLPGYQFDKSRHWLDWKEPDAPAAETPDSSNLGQTHLLQLIRKSKEQSEFRINTQCLAWQQVCQKSCLVGVSICSTSGALDLVSQAIDLIENVAKQNPVLYELEDLMMPSPIPTNPENGLTLTIIGAHQPRSWRFAIANSPSSTPAYVSGVISAAAAENSASNLDFARFERLVDTAKMRKLSNDAEADSVGGKAVYKSIASLVLVPISEQVISKVSVKMNEAAGYLYSEFNNSFAAVESFIQVPFVCLNGLQDGRDDEVFVNTGMCRVQFRHSLDLEPGRHVQWALYVKFFELQGAERTCDVFAFDAQNDELCAVILDVKFRKTRVESLQQQILGSPPPRPAVANTGPCPLEAISNAERVLPAQNAEPSQASDDSTAAVNVTEVTKSLFELLARVADVDPDRLDSDALIVDLGIDSLMGMEVAEEINRTFSIDLGVRDVEALADVGALCALIAAMVSGSNITASSGQLHATRTPESTDASSTPPASDETRPSSPGGDLKSRSDEFSTAIHEAFDAIRGDFDVFSREAGFEGFFLNVHPSQQSLVVAYISEAFAKLGCDISSLPAGETIPRVDHNPNHEKLVERLMSVLDDAGLITRADGANWVRTAKPVSPVPASQMFDRIQADFPHFATDHKLLQIVGSRLHDLLPGKLDPLVLLFGNPKMRGLVADLYGFSPSQSPAIKQLVSVLKRALSSRRMHHTLQILEVGGGTCGTSLPVVAALAELGIPVEYTFTDISSSFVSAAKSKLVEHKFVRFRTFDISQHPATELLGRFDMVIANNVIHATRDACRSVSNVRQMLRPGGFLALAECTSDKFYLLDVIFGPLEGWWLFDDGRSHALMDERDWETTLRRAGFGQVDWSFGQNDDCKFARIILAW